MTQQPTLFTFGYLSSKAERIIRELIAVRTPIVDIRFNPASQNWRYKQESMQQRDNIIYHHIIGLGNELYKQALSGKFTEPHVKLHNPEQGLQELEQILQQHNRAAIFCACNTKTCHRFTVAELAKQQLHVRVIHL